MIGKFIGGLTIHRAIENISKNAIPYIPIFDYAKESASNKTDTYNYVYRISQDIPYMYGGLALKYSSFNCQKSMRYIIKTAQLNPKITAIYLDAECNKYNEIEQKIYDKLLRIYNRDRVYLYKTYQMYRRDSMETLVNDINISRSIPIHLGIKLVRGAYLEKDKKTGVLFDTKEQTDQQYNLALEYVLEQINTNSHLKLLVATHNNKSIDLVLNKKILLARQIEFARQARQIEFAQLLGMNDKASKLIHENGYKVYKYVPYGSYLETYPYLMRRFYENYQILQHMLR
jgi:proline dehydrogenase